MTSKPKTKRIPVAACRLRAGLLDMPADEKVPARILARTGDGISHWYWGQLVQDFAGMQLLKDRLALDYCHDPGDIVGYAEHWTHESGDLVCDGTLLTEQSERAASVVNLARAGVPFEASISFQPLSVEYLDSGQSATVNGRLVDGPAAVVRSWILTGLAVCPRGADPNTKTELAAGEGGEIEVTVLSSEVKKMPDEIKTADQIKAELKAAHAEFSAKHGAELAAKWGPLGDCELSMDGVQEFVQQLRDRAAAELAQQKNAYEAALAEAAEKLTTAEAKATDLTERLAAVKVGEESGVGTAPQEGELSDDLRAGLSPAMAKHVARMRARTASK
jgi:hypothetical protein